MLWMLPQKVVHSQRTERRVELYPPLPCRASPPQGGRSICGKVSHFWTLENEAMKGPLADLPP